MTYKCLLVFTALVIALSQNGLFAQIASTGIKLEIRLAEYEPGNRLIETNAVDIQQKLYLHKQAIVTNRDVIEARVERFPHSKEVAEAARSLGVEGVKPVDEAYEIRVTFTREAGDRMAKATKHHIGKPLALLIDGRVISAPTVNDTIRDRARLLGGGGLGFTRDEAQRIANALNKR